MDISSIIINLLQQWPGTASAITLVGVFGYILTHVMPLLPVPAAGATGWWAKVYPVLAFLSGNWGSQATPVPPSAPKATP